MTNFSISDNTNFNCYNPLVCTTKNGHLVVWICDNEENIQVKSVHFKNKVAQRENVVCQVGDDETLLFLTSLGENYLLAIEKNNSTSLILLEESGVVVKNSEYSGQGLFLKVCPYGDDIYFFVYQGENVTVFKTNFNEPQWDSPTQVLVHNVYSIPQVLQFDDRYLIAWMNGDDKVEYYINTFAKANVNNSPESVELDFDVDYLLAAKIASDTVALCGYNTPEKILRTSYYKLMENDLIKISNRFWKTVDYCDKSFYLGELRNGFVLLTDGPKPSYVNMQRFTKVNTWLNYLQLVDNEIEESSQPQLAQGLDTTLVVYVKDFGDRSEIYGRWYNFGEIPELD